MGNDDFIFLLSEGHSTCAMAEGLMGKGWGAGGETEAGAVVQAGVVEAQERQWRQG